MGKTQAIICVLLLASALGGCENTQQTTASLTPAMETAATTAPKLYGEKEDLEALLEDTPRSTCFSRVGYYESGKLLVVEFRESGSIYEYSNFSAADWADFIAADSLGEYYNTYIKGNYPCERLY